MLESTHDLSSSIFEEAQNYFSKITILEAEKLLKLSRVSISFNKARPDAYFIISGIVKENRIHETKLVFKTRLKDSASGPITSNCDCHEWEPLNHCKHVASLFLYYHLQFNYEQSEKKDGFSRSIIQGMNHLGVSTSEYGSIIKSPHQLEGANPNSTYSSLQYILTDGKIQNFPIPKHFEGKLILHVTTDDLEYETSEINFYPVIRFMHQTPDGDTNIEISIFENLYLFDWKTGSAWHLPRELKDLVQKIRLARLCVPVDDLIQLLSDDQYKKHSTLVVNGTHVSDIKSSDTTLRITVIPSTKKNYLQFSMIFHDQDENIIPPPKILSSLCFGTGMLDFFKRKKDAYDFIKILGTSLDENDDRKDYKKALIGNNNKRDWISLIDYIKGNPSSFTYDQIKKCIYLYDNHTIRKTISSIVKNFDELAFRYSKYSPEKMEINLQIPVTTLFQGLSEFYRELNPFGVIIYYNKSQIQSWKSGIRFERRLSATQWFDLHLDVPENDLETIKNANIEHGLSLTSKGLVLLSTSEKDLIKFMKKYTQYESQDETTLIDEDNEKINRFSIPFNRARIFELFELKKMGISGALTPEDEKLCNNLANMSNITEYPIPENLRNILRPYQKTGYNWLRFLYEHKLGACLADDMGLGKTIQTIALIKSLYKKLNRVLIICPVSIILNWEKEITKFSDMSVHIYHGGERNFPDDCKIILTSYGLMKREIETTFKDKFFDILVLDEVQHLKNIRSLGSSAVRKINAGFRVCLTGTPVENDLAEFYNILDLSIPGVWGDLQFIRTVSTKKSRLLARKTAKPYILRRTKSQVLKELPPKSENTIYLNFSEQEKNNYTNNLISIRNQINTAPSRKKYGEILKGLLRLRQQCLWQKTDSILSTKIEFLMETLEQIIEEGHQVIVFSQFTTYLNIIQNLILERNWRISRIDGTQTIKKRQQQVDIFQEAKSQIFLISLKAGGVGLNLTAASYVFIMDPWWNPAVENQAIDRAHRIGQKNTLTVYRPIIKNSVEEKVLQLQQMKRQLFLDLLPENDDQYFSGKLSMNDFTTLFE